MDFLKHDITSEFPALADKIHTLKTSHQHFAKLYDSYDAINHEITKAETGVVALMDEALEDLKKRRLRLKDEMVQMLHAA